MAFCSYSIFLKIAASFSMVALVDSPVRLLLKVLKKVLTGHGLTCEVLSHFPEDSVRTGVLVPEPSPNPPEKGARDSRGLLLY